MPTTHRRTSSTSSKRSSNPFGRLLHCTRSSSVATATASDDDDERPARGHVTTEGPLHWVELFDGDRHDEAGRVCISSWEALAAVDPGVSTLVGSQVLASCLMSCVSQARNVNH